MAWIVGIGAPIVLSPAPASIGGFFFSDRPDARGEARLNADNAAPDAAQTKSPDRWGRARTVADTIARRNSTGR
jgi:hypothetical protein